MKILYLEWNSYANSYVKEAFVECGHELVCMNFPASKNVKNNEELSTQIALSIISNNVDFVFSLNYYPVAAIACKACRVKYASWTYDSPYILLYSDTILFDTNYVFIFEKAEYNNLLALGVKNVFYLPMAAPVSHYEKLVPGLIDHEKYDADISMIGSMYSEKKHSLYGKLSDLPAYDKGYLEALIEAQKFTYGTNIITQSLPSDIIKKMHNLAPMLMPEDELQSMEWAYSYYFLLREVTKRERFEALDALSQDYAVHLFTHEATPNLPNVVNRGALDYYTEMPLAMKCSKININISLRSIVTGIPLRAMDIMGCGGFLLSNFQSDFLDFFVPGEDFVFFEDICDLQDKVYYYLSHDKERAEIAHNGFVKVKENHNYCHRVEVIINLLSQ